MTKPVCVHPPERLYTWFARDDRLPSGMTVCVGCCQCGAILKGQANYEDANFIGEVIPCDSSL